MTLSVQSANTQKTTSVLEIQSNIKRDCFVSMCAEKMGTLSVRKMYLTKPGKRTYVANDTFFQSWLLVSNPAVQKLNFSGWTSACKPWIHESIISEIHVEMISPEDFSLKLK